MQNKTFRIPDDAGVTASFTNPICEEDRTAVYFDCSAVLRINSFNSSKVILQEFYERITNIKLKYLFELY